MLGEMDFPQQAGNTTYEDVKLLLLDFTGTTWKAQHFLILVLQYLNHMLTKERFCSVMYSGIGGSISYSTFHRHCIPNGEIVAANVNYIYWHRCLSPMNRHRLMPFFVTTSAVPDGQALQAPAQPREVQVHMPEGRAHRLA
jgi:hypothetical protein